MYISFRFFSFFGEKIRLRRADHGIQKQSRTLLFIVPAAVVPTGAILCFGIEALIISARHAKQLIEGDYVKRFYYVHEHRQPLECFGEAELLTLYPVGIVLHRPRTISAEGCGQQMTDQLLFL